MRVAMCWATAPFQSVDLECSPGSIGSYDCYSRSDLRGLCRVMVENMLLFIRFFLSFHFSGGTGRSGAPVSFNSLKSQLRVAFTHGQTVFALFLFILTPAVAHSQGN